MINSSGVCFSNLKVSAEVLSGLVVSLASNHRLSPLCGASPTSGNTVPVSI